jgi:hypothetical protein
MLTKRHNPTIMTFCVPNLAPKILEIHMIRLLQRSHVHIASSTNPKNMNWAVNVANQRDHHQNVSALFMGFIEPLRELNACMLKYV